MAGRQIKPFKGASDLYDAGHGHVYAEKIQPLPDNLKKKISVILEAIPSKSKSEIAEALQACDYDITRALNYFVADGEMEEEQNEWKVQGKRKKKKKKSGKKSAKEPTDSQSQNDAEGSAATASVASPDSTTEKPTEAEQKKVEQNIPAETAPKGNPTGVPKTTNNESPKSLKNLKPVSNDVPKSNETTPTPTSPPLSPPSLSSPLLSPTDSVSSSQDLPTLSKSRAGSSSNDKHPRQRTTSGSGSDIFKKTLKDLQRSAVSISRYQSMLDEHAESSTRMLAKSFQAIREALDEREKCLEEQLKSVTEETKKLLEERQEDAAGLKFKCNRAGTMSDEETAELRNEIKHFVGERRIDEDLGKTILFLRDEEKMLEAVRNFGEVPAIKHHYTSYKRKHPEPSKPVSYKPPPVKTSTASSSHNTSTTPTTTSTSSEMKNGNPRNEKRQVLSPAGLKDQAEIHARLQQAIKEQQVSPVSKESAKQSGRNAGEKPKPKNFGPKSNRNNGKEQQPRRDQTSQRQRQTSSSQNSAKSFGNRNENKSTYSENSKTPVQADGAKAQDGSPTNGVSQTQEPAENGAQTGSSADNRTQAGEDKPAEGSHVSHNHGYRRPKRRYFRKTPTGDGSPVFRAGTVNTSNNTSKENGGQSKAKNSDLPNGQLESPITNGTNGFVPLSQRNRRPRKFYMKKDPGSKIEFPPPRENGSVPA